MRNPSIDHFSVQEIQPIRQRLEALGDALRQAYTRYRHSRASLVDWVSGDPGCRGIKFSGADIGVGSLAPSSSRCSE